MATAKENNALRPTDTDGVFRNSKGVMVDKRGVAIGFTKIKKLDDDMRAEVLGHPPVSPLDLMLSVVLDPRYPIHVRLDHANKVLPYVVAKLVPKEPENPDKLDPEALAARVMDAVRLMKATVPKPTQAVTEKPVKAPVVEQRATVKARAK